MTKGKSDTLENLAVNAISEQVSVSPPMPGERKQRARNRLMESIAPDSLHIVRKEEGEWELLQEGVSIKRLYQDPETQAVTSIWRLEPGIRVASHFHDMDEECLVLDGELHVGEEILRPGDFLLGAKGSEHPDAYAPVGALLLIRAQDYRPTA